MTNELLGVENRVHGDVYGTVLQGQNLTYHAAAPRPEALRGLPPLSSVFTGRSMDMAAVMEALSPDRGKRRIVLVSGMPGVGKSEMARQVAAQALDEYGWFAGVLHHDMFGYHPQRRVDPGDVLFDWLGALGIDAENIPPSTQGKTALYRSELQRRADRGGAVLVIVDNASSVEQVSPLVPGDGNSALLVTSRHRLDIGARVHHLAELDTACAVEVLRRGLVHTRGMVDERTDTEPREAERIARLCGHLPLALRVVAAILADEPLRRLSNMADDLQGSRLDGLEREENAVRLAFDLSYRRLDEQQARLFRTLALAPGPDAPTRSAAVLVNMMEPQTRRILATLARASLLDASGDERWRMHDLTREFASEKAEEPRNHPGDRRDLVRLIAYLRNRAEDAATGLLVGDSVPYTSRFPDMGQALRWLESEQHVLTAAVLRAKEIGELVHAANLPRILTGFLRSRLRYAQLDDIARIGYQAAEEGGDQQEMARLALLLAINAWHTGDLERAMRMSDFTHDHAILAGDTELVASAADTRAVLLRRLGRAEEALVCHDEAARIFERAGAEVNLARSYVNAANALHELGRSEESLFRLHSAVDIYVKCREVRSLARACLNLGGVYLSMGNAAEAFAYLSMARDNSADGGDPMTLGSAYLGLGSLFYQPGHFHESEAAWGEALAIFENLGDVRNARQVMSYLAQLYQQTGRHDAAAEIKRRADALLWAARWPRRSVARTC
ncbi:tetratricopeptide repeat protein [Nocardiopsis sp. NPDC058789]|uniref:tetratricopeptide repeat protein n=1 Tax=Nocardiopsis sp. NPDC058789 TaxID=3346634 RepID=UPI003671D352